MVRRTLRSPRLERKTHREKARRAALYAVGALLAIVAAVYALMRPEMRIRDIEVSGTARVSKESVKRVVTETLDGVLWGLIPKSHTLFFPRTSIRESLLEDFPELSHVSLSLRNLAALRVSVREREPAALWCISTAHCFLMDATGFVFAEARADAHTRYRSLVREATLTPVGTVALESARLTPLLSFLEHLESRFKVQRVLFPREGEIEVVLEGGVRLLSREGEYEAVLTRLDALLLESGALSRVNGELSVAYIDLRYGNKIYVKPR